MDSSQKEQPLQLTCGSIAQCIAQRDNYEAIFNSLNEGLAIIGSNRTVTMCNRPFFDLTGLRESAVIGKNITALFCKNEACGLNQAILKTIKSGKPVKDEAMDLLCADGKKISAVFATSILHDKKSRPTGIVVVFRDVSQVQELQKKLH